MPWLKKAARPHSCNQPYADVNHNRDELHEGSIWQCDNCGRYWKLIVGEWGLTFRLISEQSARRALRNI